MSTNYNQLLKDIEIGSVYVKILICFLGCTFMLYPFLFYFTHFFRELSVYEQIFFTLGSSALYLGLGLPFSIMGPVRYPACFYTPMILLTCAIVICFSIYLSVDFFLRQHHYAQYCFQNICFSLSQGQQPLSKRKRFLKMKSITNVFSFFFLFPI